MSIHTEHPEEFKNIIQKEINKLEPELNKKLNL